MFWCTTAVDEFTAVYNSMHTHTRTSNPRWWLDSSHETSHRLPLERRSKARDTQARCEARDRDAGRLSIGKPAWDPTHPDFTARLTDDGLLTCSPILSAYTVLLVVTPSTSPAILIQSILTLQQCCCSCRLSCWGVYQLD